MGQRSFEVSDEKPLNGLHGVVYGVGPLGLFTAFALARNGARVTMTAKDPIEKGIGFVNAAGLFEPVASNDPRASRYLVSGLAFCAWAHPDADWGVEPRSVLFLSDDEAKVNQDWMRQLESYRRATAEETKKKRKYGAWFDSYVLQPNIAIKAIRRELRQLGITNATDPDFRDFHLRALHGMEITSAARAATRAQELGADFFVLALGLGLATIPDIEHVAGTNAMLSAGVGITIVMPIEDVGLDHVIMDDTDLGYLIPQRTQVIGGGTNYPLPYDDPDLKTSKVDPIRLKEVREKISYLWPDADPLKGEVRVGGRPVRADGKVLTATIEPPYVPLRGIVIGGAGGSGWTYAVGIADDVAREIAEQFGRSETVPLVPLDLGEHGEVADTGDEPG